MLSYRFATENDVDLIFKWANDKSVRIHSYNKEEIDYVQHTKWFSLRIHSDDFLFFIFSDINNSPVGLVRIEKGEKDAEAVISISIDADHRGKGYSVEMLKQAIAAFYRSHKGFKILAYILKSNEASYKAFNKAGFKFLKETVVNNEPSYVLYESQ